MLHNPSGPSATSDDSNQATATTLKLLVVDDHPLFRAGLRHLLTQLGSELEIAEAGSGDQALGCLEEDPAFDLVLVDLLMPGVRAGPASRWGRWPESAQTS